MFNIMTYKERIDELVTNIHKSGHNISFSIQRRNVTCEIDGIKWETHDCDAVVALTSYLEGVWRGYALGLVWAKDNLRARREAHNAIQN